ncbi:MAG: hypothetical protein JXN61_14525 [Sedimentisphaerales bacterium]|nr:hypothetical protein [Sedimentisphaerales bacterium]
MLNSCSTFSIYTVLILSQPTIAGDKLPVRVAYEAGLPADAHPKLVEGVEIAADAAAGPADRYWYRVTCKKVCGHSFKVWLLTKGRPFAGASAKKGSLLRYILQEPNQPPIEYVNERSGKALLPMFDLREKLLPRATEQGEGLLFEKGTFLGHPLVRSEILDGQPVFPPKDITRLTLNPDLLIGTSRNFRDDGKGRKTEKDNYNYIPFTKENYDEMIAAGVNYFTAQGEQIDWIKRRAVFYEGYSPQIDFPEELFRPNFKGLSMFIDEPACILAGKYPRDALPRDAVKVIQDHIRERLNNRGYESILRKSGIDLGSLELPKPDVPIWETYVCTSYYQLEVNPTGIIQECRWQIRPGNFDRGRMLQRINAEFGTSIPDEAEPLFLWYYSQMIGPARALHAKWGMSIYGHAEQELRIPSMKLAYDLGAAYIWFWTSDHNHHVPYTEQLALAREITDYAKAHPRPPLAKLMARAKKAIVLPYGYTLPSCWELDMYGSYIFALSRKNELGITYKDILAPAVKEIENCLKNKIPYDVIPAGKEFNPAMYDEIIRIKEDKSVTRQSQPRSPSKE